MKKRLCKPIVTLLLFALTACNGVLEARLEREQVSEPGVIEKPILRVGVQATSTPTPTSNLGRLAYVAEGDIWIAEPSSGTSRRLTHEGGNAAPRWSPSGEWLSFEKDMTLWAMRADGSDAQALVAPGLPRQVAWSPTEDRLAYVTEEGTLGVRTPPAHWPWWGEGRLIPNVASEQVQQVNRFAWSPDGQWLACEILEFADLSQDTPARQILRRVRRDGAYATNLVALEVEPDLIGETIRLAGWSGDGAHVLYWRGRPEHVVSSALPTGLEFLAVPAVGGEPQGLATPPTVAPNLIVPRPGSSNQVALVAGGGTESILERRLMLAAPGERSLQPLSAPGQLVTAQVPDVSPTWSPDGEWIAYAAFPASEIEVTSAAEQPDDEVLNARLSERRIWVVRADGSDRRQVTDDVAYRDEWPRWSSDGEHILFIRVREGRAGLWLMDREGGHLQPVVGEISVAPGATYADGDRLFDWWQGTERTPSSRDRIEVIGQGGIAQQVVVEFLQAVVDGDVERALSYWDVERSDQSAGYPESVRRMVANWATEEDRYVVGLTTYGGLVAPGEYRTLDPDDPRAEHATVEVRVNGLEQWFSLDLVGGRWRIEGLMTP